MSDPVAVLTGATGWLGTALTTRLLAKGYRIGATYLIPDEAVGYEERFPYDEDRLVLRRVNAVEREKIDGFMASIAARFGRVDVVGALVGGWAGGRDVADTDDIRFDRMIDLNLRSAFCTVRAAIPYLEAGGGGRILLVGSRAAVDTPPGQAAFNIAKAGVVALAKTAALELEEARHHRQRHPPDGDRHPRDQGDPPLLGLRQVAHPRRDRRSGRIHPDRRVRGHVGRRGPRLREGLTVCHPERGALRRHRIT